MTRTLLGLAVALGTASAALGQPAAPPPPPDRYGIEANPEAYPRFTPKEALAAVVRAADRGRIDYLAAQLLDPDFVDARVAERARPLEGNVEREYRALRDRQRLSTPAGQRLPADPAGFQAVVAAEARRRAFRQFAQDVRSTLAENPDHLRELERFAREGAVAETGDTARVTLKDVKDREVFLRKIAGYWYVLDQKREPATPPPVPAGAK